MKGVQLDSGRPPGSTGAATAWRAVTGLLRGTTCDLVNAFFPSGCHLCGGPLLALAQTPVCDACAANLKPQADRDSLCVRCGEGLAMESRRFAAATGESQCSSCRMAPPPFERAVAYADYDDHVRELMHLLKFNGMFRLANSLLAEGIAEAVLQLRAQAAADVVVIPVPMFSTRERSRGFNQATLLARAAVARIRKTDPAWNLALRSDLLQRLKDTNASFAMNPSQRRKSLAGAFRVVDPAQVLGREVLLVDDILTTGATARECAKVLQRAGAAKIWVATYARAQEDVFVLEKSFARWDAAPAALIFPDARKQMAFVERATRGLGN